MPTPSCTQVQKCFSNYFMKLNAHLKIQKCNEYHQKNLEKANSTGKIIDGITIPVAATAGCTTGVVGTCIALIPFTFGSSALIGAVVGIGTGIYVKKN